MPVCEPPGTYVYARNDQPNSHSNTGSIVMRRPILIDTYYTQYSQNKFTISHERSSATPYRYTVHTSITHVKHANLPGFVKTDLVLGN